MTSSAAGELIHISTVARDLGLSEYQMKGLVERGEIAATKVGRRTYILRRAVEEYLEKAGRAS